MTSETKQSITRDRFIPFRKQDIIKLCREKGDLNTAQQQSFSQLCRILESLIHFEFHQTLESLKNNYAPFNPNADTRHIHQAKQPDAAKLNTMQQEFAETFKSILNSANFEQVTEQDLTDALNEESVFKVRLEVEFDDFEQVVFYRRGEYHKKATIKEFWGLKEHELEFTNYDRVAVYIKFKDAEYFKSIGRENLNFSPGSTIIKLFQDVPKADLEMLFPDSEVRMRKIDKIFISISAVIGGAVVLVTKLGASLLLLWALFSFVLGFSAVEVNFSQQQLMALILGLGVFGGFIYKEHNKFKNRKIAFMKALSDSLYFKNLDNNAGVFHHLIDTAEEEEFKEAILAYYALLTSPEPLTETQVDKKIEDWFSTEQHIELDFEVDDAMHKLQRFGLVTQTGNLYQALSLEAAQICLDKQWDDLFDCHHQYLEK